MIVKTFDPIHNWNMPTILCVANEEALVLKNCFVPKRSYGNNRFMHCLQTQPNKIHVQVTTNTKQITITSILVEEIKRPSCDLVPSILLDIGDHLRAAHRRGRAVRRIQKKPDRFSTRRILVKIHPPRTRP